MARGTHVWFNGKVVLEEKAKISLFTHALHYGVGAFEGIRAYKQKKGGGAVFRLNEHIDRLFETCKILDIKIPFSAAELITGVKAVCKANGFDECYIRPICYVGDGPLGVNPGENPPIDVAILNWEWGSYLGDKGINEGTRLKISSYIRPHVNSAMTKGKITGQYVNGVLAKREAVACGFDEALLLDAEGYLTEGTGENLFMVKDGVLKTTGLNSILNGITRRTVMEYFKHKGLHIVETRFTRDELWCADEIFLTGTAAEVTPVKEIDGRPIGKASHLGKPGPLTQEIQKAYQDIVHGTVPDYAKTWLTPL
jgi:branched-chain amino acid aminotransferase